MKGKKKGQPLEILDLTGFGHERIHGSIAADPEEAEQSRQSFYNKMYELASIRGCLPEERIHVWRHGEVTCNCGSRFGG